MCNREIVAHAVQPEITGLRYYGGLRVLEVAWMSKPGQLVLVALRKMIASGELGRANA